MTNEYLFDGITYNINNTTKVRAKLYRVHFLLNSNYNDIFKHLILLSCNHPRIVNITNKTFTGENFSANTISTITYLSDIRYGYIRPP